MSPELLRIMTVFCVLNGGNESAARVMLKEMTKETDQELVKVELGKAVALLSPQRREWVGGLF
jgi:uncharacterized membrane protein